MARIEDLASRYQGHISAPWQMNLAGGQKTVFVVYPKVDERRLRARLELFELGTKQAGHGWHLFDFTDVETVRAAAEAGLDRMFPNFRDADDNRWPSVINRAKNGDEEALQAVDWKDTAEKHTVCARLMAEVGTGKRGKEITGALRKALKTAHSELAKAHAREMKALESSDNWGKLTEVQRTEILETEGIAEVPGLSIGDDAALLKTLAAMPLPVWKTKTDALVQQFSSAALAVARLLEPKAQSLKFTKATFHTEEDADAWWDENRKQIVNKLKDGPVIIG